MEISNNKKVHAYLSKTILEVLSREVIDTETGKLLMKYLHIG